MATARLPPPRKYLYSAIWCGRARQPLCGMRMSLIGVADDDVEASVVLAAHERRRLCRLTPSAVEQAIGCSHTGRRCFIWPAHDVGERVNAFLGVLAAQGRDVRRYFLARQLLKGHPPSLVLQPFDRRAELGDGEVDPLDMDHDRLAQLSDLVVDQRHGLSIAHARQYFTPGVRVQSRPQCADQHEPEREGDGYSDDPERGVDCHDHVGLCQVKPCRFNAGSATGTLCSIPFAGGAGCTVASAWRLRCGFSATAVPVSQEAAGTVLALGGPR